MIYKTCFRINNLNKISVKTMRIFLAGCYIGFIFAGSQYPIKSLDNAKATLIGRECSDTTSKKNRLVNEIHHAGLLPVQIMTQLANPAYTGYIPEDLLKLAWNELSLLPQNPDLPRHQLLGEVGHSFVDHWNAKKNPDLNKCVINCKRTSDGSENSQLNETTLYIAPNNSSRGNGDTNNANSKPNTQQKSSNDKASSSNSKLFSEED